MNKTTRATSIDKTAVVLNPNRTAKNSNDQELKSPC